MSLLKQDPYLKQHRFRHPQRILEVAHALEIDPACLALHTLEPLLRYSFENLGFEDVGFRI